MEDVKISIDEEGTLKVVKNYNFRFLATRAKGSGRHRVFGWVNCNRGVTGPREDPFVQGLKTCFLVALILTGVRLLIEVSAVRIASSPGVLFRGFFDAPYVDDPRWQFRNVHVDWKGFLLLSIPAVATVSWMFLKRTARKLRKRALITELKKQEVKTVSALIRQSSLDKLDHERP